MGLRLRGGLRIGGRFCRGDDGDGDGGGGACGRVWQGRLLSGVEWRGLKEWLGGSCG